MATITGTATGDTLTGTGQADRISGLGGADWLTSLGGNDELDGGAGADLLNGGDGFDTASYRTSASGVSVYLDLGYGQGGDAAGDGIYGVEGAIGSAQADLLVGTDGRNVLRGEGAGDSLLGKGGDDELEGGAGGDGLFGDAGFDVASYRGSDQGVFVSLEQAYATGGHATGDSLVSIEGVIGSAHTDELFGSARRDVVHGGGGDDGLSGYGGDDVLDGGDGRDFLNGGVGNDELRGGAGTDTANFFMYGGVGVVADLASGTANGQGNDRLFSIENLEGTLNNDRLAGNDGANRLDGYLGADVLVGRGGGDQFVYEGVSESTPTAPDRILDFSRTQGDRINLAPVDANEQMMGDQSFTFIGTKAFTGAGQLRAVQRNGDTIIEANVSDTTAGAELRIVLDPAMAMQVGDFVL